MSIDSLGREFHVSTASQLDIPTLIDLTVEGGHAAHFNPALGIGEEVMAQITAYEYSLERHAKWQERIALSKSPESYWRIAIAKNSDGQVVGLCEGARFSLRKAGLMTCYVSPEWRQGGSTGVAQALFEDIAIWLKPAAVIDVIVASYNKRSQGFFRRNGFVIPGEHLKIHDVIPAQRWYKQNDPRQDGESND